MNPNADIIITSGGENIAPVPIESRIKSEVPFLSHVMVIGDHRKFLTCLVTLLVSQTNHKMLRFFFFSFSSRLKLTQTPVSPWTC